MRLDNYTLMKMQEQISNFLFIKWLKSERSDWWDEEIRELWDDYHKIMNEHINVID